MHLAHQNRAIHLLPLSIRNANAAAQHFTLGGNAERRMTVTLWMFIELYLDLTGYPTVIETNRVAECRVRNGTKCELCNVNCRVLNQRRRRKPGFLPVPKLPSDCHSSESGNC